MPVNWRSLVAFGQRVSAARGVFAAGAALAVLAWAVADSRIQQHALVKADVAINDAVDSIRARINSSFDLIYAAQGLFRTSEHVSREEFKRYISGLGLKERHPAIRSVTYSELVSNTAKARFEDRVRRERARGAAAAPAFSVRPAGERPEYVPIVYIEPAANHGSAIGLDLYTGERRESVERARDTGVPVASGRVTLSIDPAAEPAFTVRLALYHDDMPISTVEERRKAFRGVVSATLIARELVGDILTHSEIAPLGVKLYDRVAISGAQALGAQPLEYVLFEKAAPRQLSTADKRYFDRNIALDVGGRSWYLTFNGSADDFMTPTERLLPSLLLFGGILVSGLLAALIGSLASSRERAHLLAASITENLRESEAKLLAAQRLTEAMIEALPNPIFVKDRNGRYVLVNRAWEAFFGVPRSSIIGQTVYELYPADGPFAEKLFAHDRGVLDRQESVHYEAVITTQSGAQRDAVVYKASYCENQGAIAGLVGTIIDITERKQVERRQAMEHAITRTLAEADSVDSAIPKVIETICTTMGWDYGDRYELDAEAGVLRRREFWTVDTPQMQAFAASAAHRAVKPDASGTGLVRRTYAGAKPVWIADVSKHSGFQRKELIERAGLHGAFALPLTAGGQVLGVMEFFHRDVREPDAMLIDIAEAIGSQIGQFIVRMQAEEAVKFVAMHDSLTNLPNRVMFNERLEQAIAQAGRHDRKLAVMFIDLDRFKVINDTLGHESGDLLLRDVAQRITSNLRTGDMVARLGGDEFVVLLEDLGDASSLASVAEKLIVSLTSDFTIAGREVHVSASIGISTYPADAQDMRSLMRFADIAMYRAKEQGRNTFQFYSDHINIHSVERLTLESQLRGALRREELVLHYQPVVDAKTGAVLGMEALVRWQHGDDLLPPGKFIGIAEETGLIVPIGEWVLETACRQQRKWTELGLAPMRVAVNLSPRQFVHRQLVDDIVRVLSRTGCDTHLVELEITESTVMHNAPRAIALLSELKSMGIRIAIDDFGTGYSSLAYLKRFPIDRLKIDRSFVADVPRDAGNTAITQAIIAMAHSLDLQVIAEGVETAEQLQFLREQGCDDVQGYYLSVPLRESDATAYLRRAFAAQQATNVTVLEQSRRRR